MSQSAAAPRICLFVVSKVVLLAFAPPYTSTVGTGLRTRMRRSHPSRLSLILELEIAVHGMILGIFLFVFRFGMFAKILAHQVGLTHQIHPNSVPLGGCPESVAKDNLFLQLSGRKRFRLFRPGDHARLYARGAADPGAPHVSWIEDTRAEDLEVRVLCIYQNA